MKADSFPSPFLVRPQIFPTKRHLSTLGKSWRRMMIILGVVSLALLSLVPAWAGDGALDPTFNPGVGVQKIPIIRGEADWTDGSGVFNGVSLIYGYFTSITSGGTTYNDLKSIAKLNDTGGTVDTNFSIPVVGEVRGALLEDPTDPHTNIIIWGNFSLTSGTYTFYNLAGLKWNGSAYAVDTTFPQIFNQVTTGQGVPVSAVNVVAKQTLVTGYGTTISYLVGGYNMQVHGDTSNRAYHLIRLSSDGIWDSTYSNNNPARALPGGNVNSIGLSDPNFPNQARIFGTLPKSGGGYDYMQLTGTDLSTIVAEIVAGLGYSQVDSSIFGMAQSGANKPWVIWGTFSQVFGTAINRVAVLKSDLSGLDNTTSPYASFNSGIISGGGANRSVQQCYPQWPNVVLAGTFTSFNGTTYGHLVRLNANGIVDTNFNNGGSGLDDRPFRLFKTPNTTVVKLVGAFRNFNGLGNPRGGIAVLDSNGVLQPSYAGVTANSNTPGTVYAVEGGDGLFIIGGDFTGVGGKYHQNLARLNYDGSTDHSFTSNVDGVVNSLRSRDGKLLVAGNFGPANGVGRTSLAQLNVDTSQYPIVNFTLDNSFNPAVTKTDGTVAGINMADYDDSGLIIIGGHFDNVNGSASTAVARLLSTGALDTSFTFYPSELSDLTKIRVIAGGKMGDMYPIVGKATYGGNIRGFGCRLQNDGHLDPSFAIGQSPVANAALFDGEVINGGNLPDGRLFLCGNFNHINDGQSFSIPRGYIARFTANGLLDTTWAPDGANGPIASLDIQPNGKILIGGSFTTYNSIARNSVARLNPNGSLDTAFNPGSGADGPVYLISYWGQNNALIAGGFTIYNGISRPGIALIRSVGNSFNPAINYLLLLN